MKRFMEWGTKNGCLLVRIKIVTDQAVMVGLIEGMEHLHGIMLHWVVVMVGAIGTKLLRVRWVVGDGGALRNLVLGNS